MARWIVIGTAPGWDDLTKFTAEMKPTGEWRVDPRTTVTTVTVLEDGRLLAECHGSSKADLEPWFQKKGWQIESWTPIKHIAQAGDIWKVG